MIGWHKTVLISDWLTLTDTNLWLVQAVYQLTVDIAGSAGHTTETWSDGVSAASSGQDLQRLPSSAGGLSPAVGACQQHVLSNQRGQSCKIYKLHIIISSLSLQAFRNKEEFRDKVIQTFENILSKTVQSKAIFWTLDRRPVINISVYNHVLIRVQLSCWLQLRESAV